MEPPSSPSSTITIPPDCREDAQRLAKMITEAMTCHLALLHYDRASKSMVEWCWPADGEGKKIPPCNLEKYRETHDFKYPCCLCADSGGIGAFVETAVYSWWNETAEKSRRIARCASDTCGYQVKIDTYFPIAPFAAFQYPRRVKGPKNQKPTHIRFRWTVREQTELLNKLSSSVDNEITAEEFQSLFKKCKKCMRVGAHHIKKTAKFKLYPITMEDRDTEAATRLATPKRSFSLNVLVFQASSLLLLLGVTSKYDRTPLERTETLNSGKSSLAPTSHLQTELKVLSFLLKDRVYTGNLWELVGERTIEAKQELMLQQHQNLCAFGLKGRKHSGYRTFAAALDAPKFNEARFQPPFNKLRTCFGPRTSNLFNIYARQIYGATSEFSTAHGDKRTSVIMNSIGPSLPILNTWVAMDVQEAFYSAFHAEQACQAELLSHSLPGHTWQRNIGLEFIILQAKMCRAQAEINLYSIAIAKDRGSIFSNNTCGGASPSSSRFVPPPLPDEMCYYDDDIDSELGDFKDFEYFLFDTINASADSTVGNVAKNDWVDALEHAIMIRLVASLSESKPPIIKEVATPPLPPPPPAPPKKAAAAPVRRPSTSISSYAVKLDILTCHRIIKKPMNMSTMWMKKLRPLMIRHCFLFNLAGTPVNQAGIELQRLFDNALTVEDETAQKSLMIAAWLALPMATMKSILGKE
ncbi:uncharacterized protein HD556DRAFT_1507598 [Suillus plorans]|uniref:Uncharacterized protein n=1 Tax=Suillus plorans TaxID=116603 RepID=A0A9P7ABZ0_9AGAM|nr:uncharacterized protein HD556DRAFT_1507598 [Suillus plorans]KAG1786224.1 hypothetical protein HD556DRAFT_1507598 [Suillus plorans]